jgi:hypothetical protein
MRDQTEEWLFGRRDHLPSHIGTLKPPEQLQLRLMT